MLWKRMVLQPQLADEITPCTTIPNYILNAIFDATNFIYGLRLRIINYRLKTFEDFQYFKIIWVSVLKPKSRFTDWKKVS